MFKNLGDLLREVFWLKPSAKRTKKVVKKKIVRKKATPRKVLKKPPIKKVPVRKTAVKKPLKAPKKPLLDPNLTPVGEITHFFDRIKVGVVKITQGTILIGDRLTFKTKSGIFVQKVWSMQIESQDVKVAKKGQLIGLKIEKQVAVGDIVYK